MAEIKDKKIKVYSIKAGRDLWQKECKTKLYIHNESGLWAYVRELSEVEKQKSKAAGSEQSTIFKVNFNAKLEAGMYLEFYGRTYRIVSIDGFEFYKRDLTIRAVSCVAEVTDACEYDEQ